MNLWSWSFTFVLNVIVSSSAQTWKKFGCYLWHVKKPSIFTRLNFIQINARLCESYSTGQPFLTFPRQQPREILLMQLHSTQSNIKSNNSPDSDSSPLLHFKLWTCSCWIHLSCFQRQNRCHFQFAQEAFLLLGQIFRLRQQQRHRRQLCLPHPHTLLHSWQRNSWVELGYHVL